MLIVSCACAKDNWQMPEAVSLHWRPGKQARAGGVQVTFDGRSV